MDYDYVELLPIVINYYVVNSVSTNLEIITSIIIGILSIIDTLKLNSISSGIEQRELLTELGGNIIDQLFSTGVLNDALKEVLEERSFYHERLYRNVILILQRILERQDANDNYKITRNTNYRLCSVCSWRNPSNINVCYGCSKLRTDTTTKIETAVLSCPDEAISKSGDTKELELSTLVSDLNKSKPVAQNRNCSLKKKRKRRRRKKKKKNQTQVSSKPDIVPELDNETETLKSNHSSISKISVHSLSIESDINTVSINTRHRLYWFNFIFSLSNKNW